MLSGFISSGAMHSLGHTLEQVAHWAFWYCCDFMANLGNRTHTSYYEANTWVLLLLLPGLLALLIGVRVVQRVKLRRWRRQ
jgi:hypothetical protein